MYIPRHWHYVGPTALIVLPFLVTKQLYGDVFRWDVFWLVQYPLLQVSVEWARYLRGAGVAYQSWEAGTPPEKPKVISWDTGLPVEDETIPIKVDGKVYNQIYSQDIQPLALDHERKFARTLIHQRNNNLKVQLTETYWIKEKRFGESRDAFVSMMDKWEYHGLSGREGGQDKRVIKDWRKVRLVEQGLKLPPPPRKVL
jgi:hypothetical protein